MEPHLVDEDQLLGLKHLGYWAFVGTPAAAHGKKRHYYRCNDNTTQKRLKASKGHAPHVRAEWAEDLVWQDVKRFLENPGEVLERIKERS